jgi:hypothetical protein
VGGGGFEPPTPGFSIVLSETNDSVVSRGCEETYLSGPVGATFDVQQIAQQFGTDSADLAFLIKHWTSLSDETQAVILKLVHDSVSVSTTS